MLCCFTIKSSALQSLKKFTLSLCESHTCTASEHIMWRQKVSRTVEALRVVELDILSNTPACILQIQETLCTQALLTDGAMKSFGMNWVSLSLMGEI
jgi:hypothetical protein